MSEATPPAAAAPKSRAWIMPALVGVNVLAMAGLGAFVALSQRNVAHAGQPAAHAPAHEAVHFGPIVDVESMLTNLNDPTGEHYIKMTVRLEVANEAAVAQIESGIVPIRDRYLAYLSGLSVADALGPTKQTAIRRTLKTLANEVLGRPLVRNVYLAEFVVQ